MDIHLAEQSEIILLKVPEYLYSHWEQAAVDGGGVVIGHLGGNDDGDDHDDDNAGATHSAKRAKKKKKLKSSSRIEMHVNTDAIEGLQDKPTQFTIAPRQMSREHLEVLSRDAYGEVTAFGRVHFKADMKPVDNRQYRQMKKTRVAVSDASLVPVARADDASKSVGVTPLELKRKRAQLQKERVANAKLDREAKLHRKRLSPKELRQLLFRIFETSQYVSMRQLERETKESKAILQAALGPVAVFHRHGANRNMYELKEEFRTTAPE